MKLQTSLLKSACVLAILIAGCASATPQDSEFNSRGNILIADQFNNRVIEVDSIGKIVWQFGLGPADFSPASIIGVNDAPARRRSHFDGRHGHPRRSARSAQLHQSQRLPRQPRSVGRPRGTHRLAIRAVRRRR